MSTPINLNQFRKQKARATERATADANAVKFGRSKAQRAVEEARALQAKALLDGHLTDKSSDTGDDA